MHLRYQPKHILILNADPWPSGRHGPWLGDPAFRVVETLGDTEEVQIAAEDGYDAMIAHVTRSFGPVARQLNLLRKQGCLRPVIVMSVPEQRQRCVDMLDAGADDFVFEDIDPTEFAARVFAAIRKASYSPSRPVDPARLAGLTRRETLVFELLRSRKTGFVSKSEIEQLLYSGRTLDSNAIEATIYALRRKLGRDAILMRRQMGYCLNPIQVGLASEPTGRAIGADA